MNEKYIEYFERLSEIEDSYYDKVGELEDEMKRDLNDLDLIFFWVGGEVVGIGNEDRSMGLVER